VGYRWKGPFNTYNLCMTHFLLNPIFTRVKVKIKKLLKRNLPTPIGSAERNFLKSLTKPSFLRFFQVLCNNGCEFVNVTVTVLLTSNGSFRFLKQRVWVRVRKGRPKL